MTRVTRFLRLSGERRRLLVEAFVLIGTVGPALRLFRFSLVRRALDAWAHGRAPSRLKGTIVWAVEAAGRIRKREPSCLVKALCADAMLRRRNVPVRLVVGVAASPTFCAHAWVTSGNDVLVGDAETLDQYAELKRTESSAASAVRALAGRRFASDPPSPPRLDDWNGFLSALDWEGVGPLFFGWLSEIGWTDGLAQTLHDEWKARYLAETAAELNRKHETLRVCEAFWKKGIPLVLIKGTALAYGAYDRPAHRPRLDTDALVDRSDRDGISEALTDLGYARVPAPGTESLLGQTMFLRRDEHGATHVWDLHWEVSARKFLSRRLDVLGLLARAVPLSTLPHALVLPSAEALLLNALHPLLHHPEETRLIWDHDLVLLCRNLSDESRLGVLAAATGTGAVLRRRLSEAHERWGTLAPPAVLSALPNATDGDHPLLRRRTWLDDLTWDLRELPPMARLRHLAQVAVPPPEFVLDQFGLSSSVGNRLLLPFLYAARAARGVKRRLLWG